MVLYLLPAQKGERPPDTRRYEMTPTPHMSLAGDANLQSITCNILQVFRLNKADNLAIGAEPWMSEDLII